MLYKTVPIRLYRPPSLLLSIVFRDWGGAEIAPCPPTDRQLISSKLLGNLCAITDIISDRMCKEARDSMSVTEQTWWSHWLLNPPAYFLMRVRLEDYYVFGKGEDSNLFLCFHYFFYLRSNHWQIIAAYTCTYRYPETLHTEREKNKYKNIIQAAG